MNMVAYFYVCKFEILRFKQSSKKNHVYVGIGQVHFYVCNLGKLFIKRTLLTSAFQIFEFLKHSLKVSRGHL